MNVELTQAAAEQVRQVMAREGLDPASVALRVDVAAGQPGQPGSGYVLDIVPAWSEQDDAVVECRGVRLVCRKESLWRLDGVTIDFREAVTGRGFAFDRPRETRDADAAAEHAPPTEDAVRQALRHVIDPEVGLNIVDLGLVYGIAILNRLVRLTMTMTTPACPLSEHIKQDAEQSVLAHCSGAVGVEIELVWEPAWGSHMMSDEAKRQMGWAHA